MQKYDEICGHDSEEPRPYHVRKRGSYESRTVLVVCALGIIHGLINLNMLCIMPMHSTKTALTQIKKLELAGVGAR